MADAQITQGYGLALTRLDADSDITQGYVLVLQSLTEEEPPPPEPEAGPRRTAAWLYY